MLLIDNALVVAEHGEATASLAVDGGRIVAMAGHPLDISGDRLDCAGLILLPGMVDVHVHANDPGNTAREDFTTLTAAAAAGGVTTIVDMPVDTLPPPVDAASFLHKREGAAKKCLVDFALWGGLVEDNVAGLEAMARAGAAGFKAFMVDAGDDYPWARPDTLRRGLAAAARLGLPVLVHAEDHDPCAEGEQRCRAAGRNGADDLLRVRTVGAENSAVGQALGMAGETGARLHICHASNPRAVALVEEARRYGIRATVETCPHYLAFSGTDFRSRPNLLKCLPPLREGATVEGLWRKVLHGGVDMLSSDHSPSRPEEKGEALGIWDAWGGINGVQASLPLLYHLGVRGRGLALSRLAALTAANPARLAACFPRKGTIRVGSDADLVLVDPSGEWRWTAGSWLTRHANTPYLGWTGRGKIIRTMVRGTTVYADGRILADPGFGRHVFAEGQRG